MAEAAEDEGMAGMDKAEKDVVGKEGRNVEGGQGEHESMTPDSTQESSPRGRSACQALRECLFRKKLE